jgi:hypothetical protein
MRWLRRASVARVGLWFTVVLVGGIVALATGHTDSGSDPHNVTVTTASACESSVLSDMSALRRGMVRLGRETFRFSGVITPRNRNFSRITFGLSPLWLDR